MAAVPLMVEGLTDADFNARAPLHPDDVPTAREIRLKHNTWILVGFFVGTWWLHLEDLGGSVLVPIGFVMTVIMGLLIRETSKSAGERFPLPFFLMVSFVGCVAGMVTLLKGWL